MLELISKELIHSEAHRFKPTENRLKRPQLAPQINRINQKKALQIYDSNNFSWSTGHFSDTYDLLVEFITIYPKHDPVYEVKSKMDILRCHVTFCNKFVRRFPNQARSVIEDKQPGNVIHERVTRELQNVNQNGDDKVIITS